MTLFKSAHKASVKLSGNNLVLSLPDAMTPVVWMIDTSASGSFFMRVDKDDNGLYILQKVEGSGKSVKIEDIAYYADKNDAVNAMTLIANVIDNDAGSSKCSSGSSVGKFIKSIVITSVYLLVIFAVLIIGRSAYVAYKSEDISVKQTRTTQPTQTPTVSKNPDAVGVPLSADDFFEKNSRAGIPY